MPARPCLSDAVFNGDCYSCYVCFRGGGLYALRRHDGADAATP